MIGLYIDGTDIYNKAATGKIIDTIICPQMVPVGPPLQQQMLPMACTAYLVYNFDTRSIHIVPPPAIKNIGVPEE